MRLSAPILLAALLAGACAAPVTANQAASNGTEQATAPAPPATTGNGWTVGEATLEDGTRAIVLAKQQSRSRVEVRVHYGLYRTIGVYSDECSQSSTNSAAEELAERRDGTRQIISGYIGPDECRLDANVLDGFDEAFARLEDYVRTHPLPDSNAWARGVGADDITRHEPGFEVEFEFVDFEGRPRAEVDISSWDRDCPIGFDPDRQLANVPTELQARVSASRAMVAEAVAAFTRSCGRPPAETERMMRGFEEALTAAIAAYPRRPSN